MQTLFYITITYIVSVLISLITFTVFSFNERTNIMDKDDFYRILLMAALPVFNIFLIAGIFAITVHKWILELIKKKNK